MMGWLGNARDYCLDYSGYSRTGTIEKEQGFMAKQMTSNKSYCLSLPTCSRFNGTGMKLLFSLHMSSMYDEVV